MKVFIEVATPEGERLLNVEKIAWCLQGHMVFSAIGTEEDDRSNFDVMMDNNETIRVLESATRFAEIARSANILLQKDWKDLYWEVGRREYHDYMSGWHIPSLKMSHSTIHKLTDAGIFRINQLAPLSEEALRVIPGINNKDVQEVKRTLGKWGLHLGIKKEAISVCISQPKEANK